MAINVLQFLLGLVGVGGASGGAGGVPSIWSAVTSAGAVVLSGGSRTATFAGAGIARLLTPKSSGKWYFELQYVGADVGNVRLGLSPGGSSAVFNLGAGATGSLGCTFNSGSLIYVDGGSPVFSAGASVSTDVLGIAVDLDANLVWIRRNNGLWWSSAPANPATGVGGCSIPDGSYTGTASNSATGDVIVNAGQAAGVGALPSGYSWWSQ